MTNDDAPNHGGDKDDETERGVWVLFVIARLLILIMLAWAVVFAMIAPGAM